MDPHTVYRKVIYSYVRFHKVCVGHHMIDRSFKPNLLTHFCVGLWASATMSAFYTAITGTREVSLTNLFLTLLGSQVYFVN